MKCPSCGVENEEGRLVCTQCEGSLAGGKEAPKIQSAVQPPPETADELQSGIAAFKAGELDQAIAHFRAVIEKDPTNFQAYNYMGGTYYKKKMYPGAVSSFLRAAELKPDIANVHYNLGMACEGNNMVERALASYQKALSVDPGYTKAVQAIQRIQSGAGKSQGPAKVMCANHANKEALGKCMECGTPVCAACGQQVDPGPRSFDQEDAHDSVMCNRCLYAKGDAAPATVSAPPPPETDPGPAAPPPAEENAALRPGYVALDEWDKPTEKGDVRPIRPPSPKQRTYESQHEATAKRRAALIEVQEKARTKRRIIGAIMTVVFLVGTPAVYFGICGGLQSGMTKLLPFVPYLGRVNAEDKSFAFAAPWGWEKAELTPQETAYGQLTLSMLTSRDSQEAATAWEPFNAIAYTPPTAENVHDVSIMVLSGKSPGLGHQTLEMMKANGDQTLSKISSSSTFRQLGTLSIVSSTMTTHKQYTAWDIVHKRYIKQGNYSLKTHTVVILTAEYIHVFTFTAPEALYDKYKPLADVSVRTWAIKTGSMGTATD